MFNKRNILIIVVLAVTLTAFAWFYVPPLEEPNVTEIPNTGLSFLKLPTGFMIDVFADNLENPRVIAFDPVGNMLVSETKAGRIAMLKDSDGDGKSDKKITILEGLRLPHGLDFYSDSKATYLYVAETNEVKRFSYDVKSGTIANKKSENIATLPADGRHFTRTIAFGPNYRQGSILGGLGLSVDKLYMSVGSSCDVCIEDTWKRAAILESDPAGNYTAEFAGGLRNSVFFTFHPKTKEIWATEMGRDNLGDDLPPDEINIIKVAGPEDKYGAKRYGWPFCYGDKVRDKKFNPEKVDRIDISSDCSTTTPPIIKIQAHSAPLGLAFVPANKGWPKEWEGDLLVALHGSWNRSEKVGYNVVRYDLDSGGNVLSQIPEDFISGWLVNGKIYGRPVDLKFDSKGKLYISDDATGVIYKVNPK
ncbi:MAG: L-sorbosone dehydrogenase [Candidatus Yanofskybacteria bacterium GW2011_GWA1_44_21]|uniref:Pyrroloquinoline quinone-dependent pyranose dehydrogenase beta-propeller domain-containing protein n=2 Tax=Parcubacteria group TaxID=1794811 RepID=A0A1F8H2V2_9BACT|nr:MAG: L-sorbosone dehydrogenase [Candidatus Wolfebacteria bacterium GW2011_GWB1_41_12]KKT28375.1 MAG: L-sorbosone dehydrogenase [Candidatus Yanofskybacteria bacterium GW2011_GWA2_44_10]KKT50182.1 MAG: L-sorbosone dehydrogenase [Candidatus Yanofskybacteria bacterium GW2011_GWA1_44_21]OGN03523.1 MAG: hypothetical protein A2657_02460 [Candidatus Yanofskybacteria bacterium RIFCSPHIGHO2_01_FULL_44_110b]OGN14213.1 MAG: hypothetical protein A3C01_01285 [Candidatus Yanofskybacteria bacterium RIFCSPHI